MSKGWVNFSGIVMGSLGLQDSLPFSVTCLIDDGMTLIAVGNHRKVRKFLYQNSKKSLNLRSVFKSKTMKKKIFDLLPATELIGSFLKPMRNQGAIIHSQWYLSNFNKIKKSGKTEN